MKWIDYANPTSLGDALGLLAEHKGRARALAGGTDILVKLRAGEEADILVDVKDLPELNELSYSSSDGLTLGAAVPCYRIYADENVKKNYPAIIDCASLIGGTQIQGRASFGGNLCNSTPSADSIPGMIALGATCNIAGPNGTRQVAAEDFCLGPSRNVLAPDELLVSIQYPAPAPNSGANYIRFIPRNEMDIAVVGAGVSIELDNGTFKSARVSLAAVAPTPLYVKAAGDALAGSPVNDASVQAAANAARDAAKPITDMRGTVEYRKHLCEVLTRRALNTAIERAKEGR